MREETTTIGKGIGLDIRQLYNQAAAATTECLSCSHQTVPTTMNTTTTTTAITILRNFIAALYPFLTHARNLNIRRLKTESENEPEKRYKVVVVLEVDSDVQILQKVTEALATLEEPDLRLVVFNKRWTRFHYDHIDKYLEVGSLTHRCLAEKEASKTFRKCLLRLIRNSAVSSLEYASSLIKTHPGKIVFIKTRKTPLPFAAKLWIKRNCNLQVVDVYNLGCKELLSSTLQKQMVHAGCNYVNASPDDLGNIISVAISRQGEICECE